MSENRNKSRIKYYITAGFIVIVVALVLLIPRYKSYVRSAQHNNAFEAIEKLHDYIDDFWKQHQSASGFDLEKALVELKLKPKVLEMWGFAIAWKPADIYTKELVDKLKSLDESSYVYVSPYRAIIAIATDKNPIGEGKKLWYEGDSGKYHGFGADELVEPNWAELLPKP